MNTRSSLPVPLPAVPPHPRLHARSAILNLRSAILLIAFALVSCSTARPPVDRHDPEAVLHAYFAAWARGDWAAQATFMDEKYAGMAPEPVEALRLLEIAQLPGASSTEQSYRVVFEIEVKGRGVSMHSGRYEWTYYLAWNAARGSWLIVNYGAG